MIVEALRFLLMSNRISVTSVHMPDMLFQRENITEEDEPTENLVVNGGEAAAPTAAPRTSVGLENGDIGESKDDSEDEDSDEEIPSQSAVVEPKEIETPKPAESSPVSPMTPPDDDKADSASEKDDNDDDDDDDDEDKAENLYQSPPAVDKLKISPPANMLYMAQATHKYTGEDVDELNFDPEEIIFVIQFENPDEQDDGWQMGIKASDGMKGVFPENFTKKL